MIFLLHQHCLFRILQASDINTGFLITITIIQSPHNRQNHNSPPKDISPVISKQKEETCFSSHRRTILISDFSQQRRMPTSFTSSTRSLPRSHRPHHPSLLKKPYHDSCAAASAKAPATYLIHNHIHTADSTFSVVAECPVVLKRTYHQLRIAAVLPAPYHIELTLVTTPARFPRLHIMHSLILIEMVAPNNAV